MNYGRYIRDWSQSDTRKDLLLTLVFKHLELL